MLKPCYISDTESSFTWLVGRHRAYILSGLCSSAHYHWRFCQLFNLNSNPCTKHLSSTRINFLLPSTSVFDCLSSFSILFRRWYAACLALGPPPVHHDKRLFRNSTSQWAYWCVEYISLYMCVCLCVWVNVCLCAHMCFSVFRNL